MCSDVSSSEIAIQANNLSKIYAVYKQPMDRLKQFFWGRHKQYFKSFTALQAISFNLKKGDILGVIGRNGSGKSTLLQLICGTLQPTAGELQVNGRIAALLELGAGFNPDFSGKENIFMNAAILGLSPQQIHQKYHEIVAFSGIGEYIDQPVKTYSSGMYVRLAFSVAINVDPDILIIDEALSVGDGAFSKKSFEKIMQLKEAGKTILFCSHSMYQLEMLCNKAVWLEQGQLMAMGKPAEIVVKYNTFLESLDKKQPQQGLLQTNQEKSKLQHNTLMDEGIKKTRFKRITVLINGQTDNLIVISKSSVLTITAEFISDPVMPAPSFGVALFTKDDRLVTSSTTLNDNYIISRNSLGQGEVSLNFPEINLLKGIYYINLYLACDKALHVFDEGVNIVKFEVEQKGVEQGIVALNHYWES